MDIVLVIVIMILIGLNLAQSIFLYLLYQSNIKSQKDIKELDRWQKDSSVILIKLVYHASKTVEDFESASRLKNTMPKDFDFYKFNM